MQRTYIHACLYLHQSSRPTCIHACMVPLMSSSLQSTLKPSVAPAVQKEAVAKESELCEDAG